MKGLKEGVPPCRRELDSEGVGEDVHSSHNWCNNNNPKKQKHNIRLHLYGEPTAFQTYSLAHMATQSATVAA